MHAKRSHLLPIAALTFFLLTTFLSAAQPGGTSGRRPMGPPPNRGGTMGDRDRMRRQHDAMRAAEQSQQVRQKRTVRSGDLFKVVGTLQDSSNRQPIAYVNVAVLDAADSSFVKGGITDLNGYFEIDNVPQGAMLLRVSAIGYQNRLTPFTVSNNTALGTIGVAPGATQLKEVSITAARPLYAMDGEKMVYNVADDPTIQTGTTSDALQNAPGVEVDIEGNITLRGVSSVEIWVNDKPSKLTAENLKTYLETLPANALDRIETITNPSAKYATSADAVINIITSAYIKKNHFISFGLNGATQPHLSPWASYTWANERLSVNLYASGRYSQTERDGWSKTTYRKDDGIGGYDTTATEDYSTSNDARRYNGNLFANINYTVDSMTDLSFMGSAFLSRNLSNSFLQRSHSDFLATPRADCEYADTGSTAGTSMFGMFGLDYTHKYDNEGHNIRASLHGNLSNGSSREGYLRHYTTTLTLRPEYDKTYLDDNRSGNVNATLRYNRPYSADGDLSFGLGYGYQNTFRRYNAYDSLGTAEERHDLLRSHDFRDIENSAEADAVWTRRWGGFTLELGLGTQYRNVRFNYSSSDDHSFSNDDTTCNFLTFSPSIHTSYRTESMHNFKLNYTLRMRTPTVSDLTTYRRYTLDGYTTGNRELAGVTTLTHNAEIGWNKYFSSFGNIGLEGYARYSSNEIDNLTTATEEDDPVLGRIVQFSKPYNMGQSYRVGGTAFVTFRPSGLLNVRLYANLYDYGYVLEQPGKAPIANSRVSWSVRLNGWVKLWDRFQVFASANYASPTISLAAQRSARYSVNCGVRADFFKRKLSAFVNVDDLFNWGKTVGSGASNTNPYLLSESNTFTLNSRYISAGVTLRFGKIELENRAKTGAMEATE